MNPIPTRRMTGWRRPAIMLLAVLSILVLPAAALFASAPGQPILPQEQAVVDLVNQERAKVGSPPLTVNYSLQEAAWMHNELMVAFVEAVEAIEAPPLSPVHAYVTMLCGWVRAHHDWAFVNRRYNPLKPPRSTDPMLAARASRVAHPAA